VRRLERPGIRRAVSFFLLGAVAMTAPPSLDGQVDDEGPPWSGADSSVTIAGVRVGLGVFAWRDFMPGISRERGGRDRSGSPLMMSLQVRSLEGASLPAGLTVDSVWVRSPEGTWDTAPSSEPRPGLPNGLEVILRGGPKWSTGNRLDVLVRLRTPDGAAYHLLAQGQRMGRTQ
jgi:hypothetical protein